MAEIDWRSLAGPDFSQSNALRARGQEQLSNAVGALGLTGVGFAQNVQNQNTNKLMDMLYSAKNPEDYKSEQFQQGLASLKERIGQDYDSEKYRLAADSRLGKLQSDSLNGLAYQDKQDDVSNRPLMNQYYQLRADGKAQEAEALRAKMMGDTTGAFLKGNELSDNHLKNFLALDQNGLAHDSNNLAWFNAENDARYKNASLQQQSANGLVALAEHLKPEYTSGLDESTGEIVQTQTGGNSGAYNQLFSEASKRFGLSPALLAQVGLQESGLKSDARSPVGAMGLMQLMPATARARGVTNPMDPRQSVMGGAEELASLMKKYNGNVQHALTAYNWGQGNYDSYLKTGRGAKGQPIPKEAREYAGKVLKQDVNKVKGATAPAAKAAPAKATPKATTPIITSPAQLKNLQKDNVGGWKAKEARFNTLLKESPVNAQATSLGNSHAAVSEWVKKNDAERIWEGAKKVPGFTKLSKGQQLSVMNYVKAQGNYYNKREVPVAGWDVPGWLGGNVEAPEAFTQKLVKQIMSNDITYKKAAAYQGARVRKLDANLAIIAEQNKRK